MNLWCPDGKPSHVLEFQLDEHSNTPTAVNVSCTAEKRETIGPYLWSTCARHSLAFNTHDQVPVFECEHNFDTDAPLSFHHVRIPTRNLYAVTQHLLTRRNFIFLNSPRGFRRSLEERFLNFNLIINNFDPNHPKDLVTQSLGFPFLRGSMPCNRSPVTVCHTSVAGPSNVNLTPGQKELLLWHWRLGISMSRIQELMAARRDSQVVSDD
jgi:hypothetical protein